MQDDTPQLPPDLEYDLPRVSTRNPLQHLADVFEWYYLDLRTQLAWFDQPSERR
jgi:hypothetical protein